MELCARSSDVISQGTQWRRRVALAKIVLKENSICEWSEIGTEAEFNLIALSAVRRYVPYKVDKLDIFKNFWQYCFLKSWN